MSGQIFSRLLLVVNAEKNNALKLAEETSRRLAEAGKEVSLCADPSTDLSASPVDLAVVFGGDGTVLDAFRRLDYGPPVMAVNLGRLGFLAAVSPEQVTYSIIEALEGHWHISSRLMLEASVKRGGVTLWSGRALNEFVLSTGHPGRSILLSARIDNEDVMTVRGDGVIVSTPTGSTAYALSAGGPVASPELRAMIVVPVCPHQLANRPLILGPDEVVVLRHFGSEDECLSADGHKRAEVDRSSEVVIRASEKIARLLVPDRRRYGVLREKLGWGSSAGH